MCIPGPHSGEHRQGESGSLEAIDLGKINLSLYPTTFLENTWGGRISSAHHAC